MCHACPVLLPKQESLLKQTSSCQKSCKALRCPVITSQEGQLEGQGLPKSMQILPKGSVGIDLPVCIFKVACPQFRNTLKQKHTVAGQAVQPKQYSDINVSRN